MLLVIKNESQSVTRIVTISQNFCESCLNDQMDT